MVQDSLFRFAPLSVSHCREICSWRYQPPYDLYNWPDWETMVQRQEEFADPDIRDSQYAAVLDQEGGLSGFVQFFPLAGVSRLGLGLRPDLCGRGLGPSLAGAAAEEAKRRTPGNEVDLEVMVWNERARKAYEKAGFVLTDEYERMTPTGIGSFYCMVYRRPA